MLCCLFEIAVIALAIFLFIRFGLSDCDFILQLAERFGTPTQSLRGKVVWITGASSGIGKSLALDLAKVGCKLVLSARRNDLLESVKQECLQLAYVKDEDILVLPMDMKEHSSHKKCVDIVLKHFGVIDILVNNAGKYQHGDWEKIDLSVDREIFEINVFGVISLTREVLPHMMERNSGQIVVTSSLGGKGASPYNSAYGGSKFALHGYFESLRVEKLLTKNIFLTLVCPGPVLSNIGKNGFMATTEEFVGVELTELVPHSMKTSRCSQLMCVAIANKLSEVWICNQPSLWAAYTEVYAPSTAKLLMKCFGKRYDAQARKFNELVYRN